MNFGASVLTLIKVTFEGTFYHQDHVEHGDHDGQGDPDHGDHGDQDHGDRGDQDHGDQGDHLTLIETSTE